MMERDLLADSMPSESQTLVWAVVWAWVATMASTGCPKVCQCKWRDGREMVVCQNANFIDVPRGLESTTQVLDLRYNNLRILPRDSFAFSGLFNLQKLWLNFCHILWVEKGAFRKLTHVKELDLSNNYLRNVPSEALADIVSLRELRLAHNYLTIISATAFLFSLDLVHLDISYNNIDRIESRALQVLGNLEILNVAGNKITFLNSTELRPLQVLRVIKIDGNPWHCDCHLRQLSHWMRGRKLAASVPPSCSRPSWLDGRDWQTLEDSHFLCAPRAIAVAPRVLATDRDNVTLMCRVESEVQVTITWLIGETPIRNANMTHRYKVTQAEDRDRMFFVSNLTIVSVVRQDQGTYRCLAENRAGTSVSDIMLQVSHEVAEVRSENVDQVFMRHGLIGAISIFLFVVFGICSAMYCKSKDHDLQLSEDDNLRTAKLTKSLNEDLGEYNTGQDGEGNKKIHNTQSWVINDSPREELAKPGDPTKESRQNQSEPEKGSPKKALFIDEAAYVEISKEEKPGAHSNSGDEMSQQRYSEKGAFSSDSDRSPTYSSLGNGRHYPDLLDLPHSRLSDLKAAQRLEESEGQDERLSLSTHAPSFSASKRLTLASQPYRASKHRHSFSRIEPEIGRRASSLASSPLSDSAPETEDLYYRLSPSDPYRFEYHTLQLEKFLKEYRRLQEQLLYMKQSYETEQRVKSTPRLDDWLEAEEARRGVAFGPCERRASRRPSEPLKSILKKSSSTDGRRLPRRQRTSSLQIVDAREWYRGLEDS